MRAFLIVLLCVINLVMAALATVGTVTLACLQWGELMFLAWDYPWTCVCVGTCLFSFVLTFYAWVVKVCILMR